MRRLPRVSLWVDASFKQTTRDAGIGVVVVEESGDRAEYKWTVARVRSTTRAELIAACEALRLIEQRERHHVLLYSDCTYVARTEGGTRANNDLWAYVLKVKRRHQIEMILVAGHANVEPNERAHALARLALGKKP